MISPSAPDDLSSGLPWYPQATRSWELLPTPRPSKAGADGPVVRKPARHLLCPASFSPTVDGGWIQLGGPVARTATKSRNQGIVVLVQGGILEVTLGSVRDCQGHLENGRTAIPSASFNLPVDRAGPWAGGRSASNGSEGANLYTASRDAKNVERCMCHGGRGAVSW